MGKAIDIILPWPNALLSPNSRKHWSSKAKPKAQARRDAFYACCELGAHRLKWSAADVQITFFPPDNRRRDLDNMLASLKSHLDGIADATGIDDSKWSISISKDEPVNNGKVIVTLNEVAA